MRALSRLRLSPDARRSVLAGVAGALALVFLIAVRNAAAPDPLSELSERDAGADGEASVYDGSWHFPRGGPYILGFEASRGAAELAIDGRVVARGEGEQRERVVFPAGARQVRLRAEGEVRPLWIPPGRRGPLEYVPPSSLSPESPDRAEFSSWAGASPVDGAIAAAALIVIGAVIAYWARRPLRRADRRTLAWAGVIFAGALAVRLVDLNGAGQTWDEDVNWSAGRNYVQNWLGLDFSQASWRWNYEHPPVMKYLIGIGAQFADGYGPARAMSAIASALACALLVPVGRRLFSRPVGVAAAATAALTPHLIAHAKVAGHEATTSLLWTAAIWAALCAHGALRARGPGAGDAPGAEAATEPGAESAAEPAAEARAGDTARLAGRLALVGLLLGLAVSARFANLLLAPLLGALLLLYAPSGWRARTLWLGLAIVPAAAIATGLAIWPRLWDAPVASLLESWERLRHPHGAAPYLGELTNTPARHYFAVYLGATAPAGILAGAIAWAIAAARRRTRADLALLLWLAVPLLVLLSPVRQDGVRYIMPSVMALSLAGAVGYAAVAEWLARVDSRRWRVWVVLGGAVLAAYLAVVNTRIHPYYLNYYGEHVGGPRLVAEAGLFEIAWWGEGLDRAIDYVNEHAGEGDRVYRGCVIPIHLTWFRHDLWDGEARRPDRADWIVDYAPSRGDCEVPADAERVFEVSAQGAPLARVYRR